MAFVITAPCQDEMAAECVEVCPVDCIEKGDDQYYIDPNVCINCGACLSVCPVSAIVEDFDMMPDEEKYLKAAEEFFKRS